MARTGIVYDDMYLRHDTGGHVERPDRLRAVMEGIEQSGLNKSLVPISPRYATIEELEMVHDRGIYKKSGEILLGGLARCTVAVLKSFVDIEQGPVPAEEDISVKPETSKVVGEVIGNLGRRWDF